MVVRITQSIPLTNLPEPSGNLLHQQPLTTAYIENENLGTGTLYVAESILQWTNNSSGLGFALEYPRIIIHAISRDTSHFPEECLYLQVVKEKSDEENDDAGVSDNEDYCEDDHEGSMVEIRLVPQDKTFLEEIFMSMNQGQKMNPDPDQSLLSDEDDEDEDWVVQFEDASDHHEGNGNGNIPNGHAHGSSEDETMDLDGGDR